MIYDRRSIRLRNYNYSKPGYYFVTLCIKDRLHFLGGINNGIMNINHNGEVVEKIWKSLPKRFCVQLDEYQLMPNHIHAIVRLLDIEKKKQKKRSLLSECIGYFKMNVSKQLGCSIWLRNYYERVIRHDNELDRIRMYIRNNPINWGTDLENM